jgi:hypothetical protein
MGTAALSRGKRFRGVKLTKRLHLVLRLGISGAIHPLPLCTFILFYFLFLYVYVGVASYMYTSVIFMSRDIYYTENSMFAY